MEMLKRGMIQLAKFSLENIFPLPFDRSMILTPFPPNMQIPKYNKYFGTSDPKDHLHQFYTLSMEIFHDTT